MSDDDSLIDSLRDQIDQRDEEIAKLRQEVQDASTLLDNLEAHLRQGLQQIRILADRLDPQEVTTLTPEAILAAGFQKNDGEDNYYWCPTEWGDDLQLWPSGPHWNAFFVSGEDSDTVAKIKSLEQFRALLFGLGMTSKEGTCLPA